MTDKSNPCKNLANTSKEFVDNRSTLSLKSTSQHDDQHTDKDKEEITQTPNSNKDESSSSIVVIYEESCINQDIFSKNMDMAEMNDGDFLNNDLFKNGNVKNKVDGPETTSSSIEILNEEDSLKEEKTKENNIKSREMKILHQEKLGKSDTDLSNSNNMMGSRRPIKRMKKKNNELNEIKHVVQQLDKKMNKICKMLSKFAQKFLNKDS